jgi:hypothetical protein
MRVRELHIGSGSVMKLYSTHPASLWLEAARSCAQRAEGGLPDKQRVHHTCRCRTGRANVGGR